MKTSANIESNDSEIRLAEFQGTLRTSTNHNLSVSREEVEASVSESTHMLEIREKNLLPAETLRVHSWLAGRTQKTRQADKRRVRFSLRTGRTVGGHWSKWRESLCIPRNRSERDPRKSMRKRRRSSLSGIQRTPIGNCHHYETTTSHSEIP